MEDVEQMLDDCDSVKDVPASRGGPGFDDWELEFLESVRDQHEGGKSLSEKQLGKLRQLWDKV